MTNDYYFHTHTYIGMDQMNQTSRQLATIEETLCSLREDRRQLLFMRKELLSAVVEFTDKPEALREMLERQRLELAEFTNEKK